MFKEASLLSGIDSAFIGSMQSPLDGAIERAKEHLLRLQSQEGYWVFELEADCTIPSEYILMMHFMDEIDEDLQGKIANFLRTHQTEDGSYPLFRGGEGDISCTVKVYYALKMAGDDINAPHMRKARAWILSQGGAAKANVFTRIMLAMFGQIPWRGVPFIPVEIMLLPKWFPFHLDKISYWSRTVIAPLLILMAKRPKARNPRNVHVPELFRTKPDQVTDWIRGPYRSGWGRVFKGLDDVLQVAQHWFPKGLRERSIQAAVDFITPRLNGEDGLGAIYPAMANAVMAFDTLGYPPEHPHAAIAWASVRKLIVETEERAYCQPCLSPVWDTGLAGHAITEAGLAAAPAALTRACPASGCPRRGRSAQATTSGSAYCRLIRCPTTKPSTRSGCTSATG